MEFITEITKTKIRLTFIFNISTFITQTIYHKATTDILDRTEKS